MRVDVAIVGGGPGGSACAMFLAELGIPAIIVERETFPRYHIGESMTGECGNLVRALGLEPEMLRRRFPVKRGVRVYGPRAEHEWFVPIKARSPGGELIDTFTWQVRRSEFDQMLLETARSRGIQIVIGQATEPLRGDDGAVRGVRVRMADGGTQEIRCEVLVDASGQSTFLSLAGVTGARAAGRYSRQIAVFSQVTGTIRDPGERRNDTILFHRARDHWAWFIPLDDEAVSVGVVVPADYFQSTGESRRAFLVRELREFNREIARRVPQVNLVEDVRTIPNYSYRVENFTGPGFLCLGDAHRFIDPIFSFGLNTTMREAQLAAPTIAAYLGGAGRDEPDPFFAHQHRCDDGLDAVQDVIDFFWEQPLAFAYMVHHRYPDEMIDLLAGRVYVDRPSPALTAIRRLCPRSDEEPSPS